jgi:hypothetical protein
MNEALTADGTDHGQIAHARGPDQRVDVALLPDRVVVGTFAGVDLIGEFLG